MQTNTLEFERPVAELQAKIEALRLHGEGHELDISEEIQRLEQKRQALIISIFRNLDSWQIVQLARHPERPHARDYIQGVFTDFDSLQGDRHFGEDPAICGGLARLNGQSIMVIAHEKGRSTKEKIAHRFGMPRPEGYRKALRLMQLAERFRLPILSFIDTPGAYPGVDAEQRNQSEAIAYNLQVMSQLKVPIVCTIIGEGGSGGALAIGVGDCTLMLQYSVYSVISPEGCASILWRDTAKAPEAAKAMGLTAERLKDLGLIDEILQEPLGGAHRDPATMMQTLKEALIQHLTALSALPVPALLAQREARLLAIGQ